ncbi:MAG: hypothetical protein ACK4FG_04490 [Brevundimonas sp.]
MSESHGHVIATAAKAALTPLGFRRRGQSRIWLADHGFWLSVIEFQPSGWAKGSYLNVAAHWLWHVTPPVMSFDHCERVGGFADAAEPDFPRLIADMANEAAATAARQRARFSSLDAVAAFLIEKEQASRPEAQGDWGAYHAGIAAGLIGQEALARQLLSGIGRDILRTTTEMLLAALGPKGAFKAAVQALNDAERLHYKLPPWRFS